jgi:4-amino-4-deoxy-L-arabinose transferase-like glycosyltransferase
LDDVNLPRPPAWATPAGVALLVLVVTLPRIYFVARYDLIGDEVYYALWSLYPSLGYYDHPPGVAWTIWLGRGLFGEGEWQVRSLFLLSTFLTCAALYRIALLLLRDARIGAVAAIAYAATPAIAITFTMATPDAPSTLFWILAVWAIAEFTRSRNANWWLLAGLFAGLGLLSKYTVVFLGAGILLYLLTSRDRIAWLRLWQVWVGGAIALLMFAPVVWIDWGRDWASFRFQLGRSTLDEAVLHPDELLRFMIEVGILVLPTLFVFLLVGIVLFFARRASGLALPLLTAVPMVAYFLVHGLYGRVNPNWISPLYPVMALIGAWAAVNVRPSSAWLRWPLRALKALHVPLGLCIMLSALAAAEYRTIQGTGLRPIIGFLFGWDTFQAKISDLAEANGAKWVEVQDYSLTGWLAYYGKMVGDPLPIHDDDGSIRYRFMPPITDEMRAAPHLIVYHSLSGRVPELAGARSLGLVTRDDEDGTPLQNFAVYFANE